LGGERGARFFFFEKEKSGVSAFVDLREKQMFLTAVLLFECYTPGGLRNKLNSFCMHIKHIGILVDTEAQFICKHRSPTRETKNESG
jgi:hypothetical protein